MTDNFSPESRVWIYLANRSFSETEAKEINDYLKQFCIQWTAHGSNLKAAGEVYYNRIILLTVDETQAGASGCSIDASVHFIQGLEKKFGIELFNRMLVGIKRDSSVEVLDIQEFKKRIVEGQIHEETIVCNTLIQTKKEFDERFFIPLKDSWLAKFLSPVISKTF